MLVDLAVLSYYDTLRVQGWIGDLAVHIEHEFFGDDAFTEMARKGHRRASSPTRSPRWRRRVSPLPTLGAPFLPRWARARWPQLVGCEASDRLSRVQGRALACRQSMGPATEWMRFAQKVPTPKLPTFMVQGGPPAHHHFGEGQGRQHASARRGTCAPTRLLRWPPETHVRFLSGVQAQRAGNCSPRRAALPG
jgi:hypothetical protein